MTFPAPSPTRPAPTLAVVIPTLNEARYLPHLLRDVGGVAVPREVVVVDGGSDDGTPDVAARAGARVLSAVRGRASQMNAGARATRAPWLCFLHADVRLLPPARQALEETLKEGDVEAAVWRFAIAAPGLWFRVVEWGARVRDRLGGLPYGDQGLLVRRTLFDGVGGFPAVPLMEDVALVRALRRRARVRRLPAALPVSARRWTWEGPYRTWLRNAALIAAYHAGVSPERLARWHRGHPR